MSLQANLRAWFEAGPARCSTREEAAAWLHLESRFVSMATSMTIEKAREYVRNNMWMAVSISDATTGDRVAGLFDVQAERRPFTDLELLQLSTALNAIHLGQVQVHA